MSVCLCVCTYTCTHIRMYAHIYLQIYVEMSIYILSKGSYPVSAFLLSPLFLRHRACGCECFKVPLLLSLKVNTRSLLNTHLSFQFPISLAYSLLLSLMVTFIVFALKMERKSFSITKKAMWIINNRCLASDDSRSHNVLRLSPASSKFRNLCMPRGSSIRKEKRR